VVVFRVTPPTVTDLAGVASCGIGPLMAKPSLNWLLVLVPVAAMVRYIPALQSDLAVFIVSGLAIIPVASWIGKSTEALARHVGQGFGGLLNATFGNAAELIIAVMALSKGLGNVVKASLTGSIIGNILLVFGLSALLGGLKQQHQRFNALAVRVSATTLMLAVVALIVPTVFHRVAAARPEGWTIAQERHLSLFIGTILILSYGALLLFTLKTHRNLFTSSDGGAEDAELNWSKAKCIVVLLVSTGAVTFLSELLVGSIESARSRLGLSETFMGIVVVATVGNAAEHSSAVRAALKNQMDLSLGIAIGSSMQIALFVAPVAMFCSYLFGNPMTLEFSLPEVVAIAISVVVVGQISSDGESNWLEGALLLAVYAVIAGLFFFLPAPR
jgi:Ca2+:H+ antiporter